MDIIQYTTRKYCRICDGPLMPFLDLGLQKLTGWLDKPTDFHPEGPLYLHVCLNPECNLVQLGHTLLPDLMFRDQDYGYKSGINQTMKKALGEVALAAFDRVDLKDGDVFVDIGANDGTLLEEAYDMQPAVILNVGYEPVKKFADVGSQRGIDYWINDYFSAANYPVGLPKAKIITACAMFYDLEDPHSFVEDVATVLADDGIFVIQLSYLPFMLALNDWPGICHEHLEYYSLKALSCLLSKHSLRVFDAQLNETNGGSLRVFIDKQVREPSFMVEAFNWWEKELMLDEVIAYRRFANRARSSITAIRELIFRLWSEDQRVFAYTASTKGNVILQACKLTSQQIPYAVERNPAKWGKYTAGSGLEIISEEEFRKLNPNYLLVFPWYFMDEFRRREKIWHDAGGQFIVPLPTLRTE